jgi:hypothetical protein
MDLSDMPHLGHVTIGSTVAQRHEPRTRTVRPFTRPAGKRFWKRTR